MRSVPAHACHLPAHTNGLHSSDRLVSLLLGALRDHHRQQCEQLESFEAQKMFMQVKGYNHFDSCFLVPFWCDSFSPRDLMHDTLCHGTLEVELCGLLNRMNAYGWLTCNLLNEVILTYSWPEGVHMPLIGEKSLRGNDSGLPTPEANLDMTAHQLLVFVIHSISILGDFVPPEELDCDIWKSWTLHCTWFLLALSKEFTLDDVRRLDITIYRHHTLFLSIPEYYDLWIPKFHFVQHIPLDILRFGPPTNWWCLMMETENGVYVHAGELSNFVNIMYSMATRVDLRRSHELYNGLVSLCERTKLCVSSVEPFCEGVYPFVDSARARLEPAARASATTIVWLKSHYAHPFKIMTMSWVLLRVPAGSSKPSPWRNCVAQVQHIFMLNDTTFINLQILKVHLNSAVGYPGIVTLPSSQLHSSTSSAFVRMVLPAHEVRLIKLHQRQILAAEGQFTRFLLER